MHEVVGTSDTVLEHLLVEVMSINGGKAFQVFVNEVTSDMPITMQSHYVKVSQKLWTLLAQAVQHKKREAR